MSPRILLIQLFILTSLLSSTVSCQKINQNQIASNPNDIEFVRGRFRENGERLVGLMWYVSHDYSDREESSRVTKFLVDFLKALENSDPTELEKLGGLIGVKNKFAAHTKSNDNALRSFSAIILGIFGDKKYIPTIAEMLVADTKYKDEFAKMRDGSRGQAAIALSMLEATEYEEKVLQLLKTGGDFDKAGAITALIKLGGKKHSRAVVDLMLDERSYAVDKMAPLNFLLETGSALEYKKELVSVMHQRFESDRQKAIAYMFVQLDAKDMKPEIAKLLNVDYVKGDAAKALALMGANEDADKISLLLADESSLVRKDAALALGILGSQKHILPLSKLLADKEGFVQHYAAIALIMMDAKDYLTQAKAVVAERKREGAFLNIGDFHPFVAGKGQAIIDKFNAKITSSIKDQ